MRKVKDSLERLSSSCKVFCLFCSLHVLIVIPVKRSTKISMARFFILSMFIRGVTYVCALYLLFFLVTTKYECNEILSSYLSPKEIVGNRHLVIGKGCTCHLAIS